MDAEGNLPWGEDGLSLNLPDAYLCNIASDNSGGVIVAQAIYGKDIICAQKVDSEGNILWQTGGVQVFVGPAEEPRVVSDGSGGAIIAYIRMTLCEDGRVGNCDSDIYAQRIDAEGDILWGPDGVSVSTGPSWPFDPGLVDDGAGGAIIFFVDERGVCARRIDANGNKLWNEDVELWPTTYHSLVSDGFSGAISVQYGGEGISAGAQRLDSAGRELWRPDGTTLTLRDMYLPLAVPDGHGGVLISWSAIKFGSDEASYYVQRIDPEGNVVWGNEGILLNP